MEDEARGQRAALAAQMLQIIGGGGGGVAALEARPSPEEPEDREGWSLEEGDDSVFYSDEDPTHPDPRAGKAGDGLRRPVNSEAEGDLGDPAKGMEGREELQPAPRGAVAVDEPPQQGGPVPPPFEESSEGGSAGPPAPCGTPEATGYHTLPLPKKAGRQGAFDHLTGSKYGTVSYRRIRRGNTREKIKDFEYMIMNL